MTQTVKATYQYSAAGQKAAILAGRPGASTCVEMMPLDEELAPQIMDLLRVDSQGQLSLDTSQGYGDWPAEWMYLDAPVEDLRGLVERWRAFRSRVDEEKALKKLEAEKKRAAEAAAQAEKAARDLPIAEATLAQLEAEGPLTEVFPKGVRAWNYTGPTLEVDGSELTLTEEQQHRLYNILQARTEAQEQAKRAKEQEEASRLEAMIAEHGGYVWDIEGEPLCAFKGYNLWSAGQSRRWVGVFTGPRGIDRFLDSPRHEHIFDVTQLKHGDCIQGGGFDTNSRGKRRKESEFFGVVMAKDENRLVVRICGSRAEALKLASKERTA